MFRDATPTEIDALLQKAWDAFHVFRNIPLHQRALFMRTIAQELEALGNELLEVAGRETHLPEARLRNERARTMFQLTSYADACERGDWLEARIDTAIPDRNPPKPDIRKIQVPLGPVVVFGAANFPFAYSTAGGDTATAFAAGCPVIVKAHPAHPGTSELAAEAIVKAAVKCGMPEGVFAHVHGVSNEVGKSLVEHPYTKAVGFTGSFAGGKQLFDWASQRKEPIPVFAEMSSINPVFLLPGNLHVSAADTARMYAGSITLGVGQFCTNPGLIIGIDGDDLEAFMIELGKEITRTAPAPMLHSGIFKNYKTKAEVSLSQPDVVPVAIADGKAGEGEAAAVIATVPASAFLQNPLLHQEVFGPYSLVIRCRDLDEMMKVASELEGQLTATVMATEDDMRANHSLVEAIKNICGRFILNGVPTGVDVCLSMQHGGPFPATTDARFGSVGADAIKRFVRPLAFQNWPDALLPDALKDENPLGIWRTVNNELRK